MRLRELTRTDAEQLDAWRTDPAMGSEFDVFDVDATPAEPSMPAESGPLLAALDEGRRFLAQELGRVAIVRRADDELIGDMSWHPMQYGPGRSSRAFNFGVSLRPDARGHGYGVEAQRLLAELLFDLFEVVRVEASTDVENHAEQRALEKAGFTREGVLRQAQFRAGAHHDLIVYSMVRDERTGRAHG